MDSRRAPEERNLRDQRLQDFTGPFVEKAIGRALHKGLGGSLTSSLRARRSSADATSRRRWFGRSTPFRPGLAPSSSAGPDKARIQH